MTDNTFNLAEEAVRTTADRINKETRRSRREFNGTTRHLTLDPRIVEELSQEGHLCFVNDDRRGHLTYLEDIGYRFVTNREAYGEREGLKPDNRVVVRYGTADDKGTPQDIYLMLQPWKFYNEDQEVLAAATSEIDHQIEEGGKEVQRGYGRTVQYERK